MLFDVFFLLFDVFFFIEEIRASHWEHQAFHFLKLGIVEVTKDRWVYNVKGKSFVVIGFAIHHKWREIVMVRLQHFITSL